MVPFAVLLLAALPAIVPPPAADTTAARRPGHRLALSVELGGIATSLSSSLADQLRDAGYDDTSPEICFFGCAGPTAHPTEQNAGLAGAITGRYAVRPALLVSLGMAWAQLGGASGYHEDTPGVLGDFIHSSWESRVFWGGVLWRPGPGLRLGGGPGWFRMKDADTGMERTVGRAGLVLEAGAELPSAKRMFFSLTLRGNLIPTTDIYVRDVVLRPSWSHLTISVGIGVHLF